MSLKAFIMTLSDSNVRNIRKPVFRKKYRVLYVTNNIFLILETYQAFYGKRFYERL